jgi:hypothetical protein
MRIEDRNKHIPGKIAQLDGNTVLLKKEEKSWILDVSFSSPSRLYFSTG